MLSFLSYLKKSYSRIHKPGIIFLASRREIEKNERIFPSWFRSAVLLYCLWEGREEGIVNTENVDMHKNTAKMTVMMIFLRYFSGSIYCADCFEDL